jgi:hypothetical protein
MANTSKTLDYINLAAMTIYVPCLAANREDGEKAVKLILRSKDYLIKHRAVCGLASGTVAAKTGSATLWAKLV